jgi:hypothetical protein
MSGQAQVGDYGNVTTTTIAGGAAGAELYQSATGTTAFAYPNTSVASFYLDGTRTDSYTPNGTALLPYTTLTQLVAAMASATGPFVIYSTPTTAAYTYTGNVSFSAYLMTIFGNGSTWAFTGNVQLNAAFHIENLYTTATGTLTYAATAATESQRIGGSLTITGGIFTSGYEHFFDMSILSNTSVTLSVGATPVFTNVVGTPLFRSASSSTAATVLTIIDSQSLATGAYTNVDMSNGGLAVIRGFIATNNSSVANINLSGSSATSTTVANLFAGVSTGIVTCGTAYTYIDNGSIIASLTGTNLLTPNGLGMSAPAAIAMTIKSGTTGAATFDSGTTGAVNIGTGTSDKTITIGGTGADTIAVGNNQVSGSVSIGTSMTTGAIHIGSYVAGTGLIEIAPGTGTQSVNVATTSTGVKTVTIGNAVSGSKVDIYGEIDGGAVGGGYIGQVLSTLVPIGSAVSLTTATPANAIGITLSAGDWDVEASVNFSAVSATIVSSASYEIGLSIVSTTLPSDGSEIYLAAPILTATSAIFGGALPRKIFRPTGSSNVYVVVNATFTAGTVAAYGSITARRAH